jgi:hypothetical protein
MARVRIELTTPRFSVKYTSSLTRADAGGPRAAPRHTAERRRAADETPHHGPTPLATPRHAVYDQSWNVQHLCTPRITAHHACGMIPKPGVAGSIPAGGATSCLHRAISCSARLPTRLHNLCAPAQTTCVGLSLRGERPRCGGGLPTARLTLSSSVQLSVRSHRVPGV